MTEKTLTAGPPASAAETEQDGAPPRSASAVLAKQTARNMGTLGRKGAFPHATIQGLAKMVPGPPNKMAKDAIETLNLAATIFASIVSKQAAVASSRQTVMPADIVKVYRSGGLRYRFLLEMPEIMPENTMVLGQPKVASSRKQQAATLQNPTTSSITSSAALSQRQKPAAAGSILGFFTKSATKV